MINSSVAFVVVVVVDIFVVDEVVNVISWLLFFRGVEKDGDR